MNNWELSEEEKSKLSEGDRKKYERAVIYKKDDWAYGPYGGWARGNELLIELGWKEETREEGHRRFTSLVKPS